ncbi:MAG: GIY-YIG nuclease family protein, partial [Verrucomicrobiota bacterium]
MERKQLPEAAGIYIVRQDAIALYVGRASNFRTRWRNHHRFGDIAEVQGDIRIYYLEMPHVDAVRLESDYIKALNPTLNQRGRPRFG